MAFTEGQLNAILDPANTGRTCVILRMVPGPVMTDVFAQGVIGPYAGRARWVQISSALTASQAVDAINAALGVTAAAATGQAVDILIFGASLPGVTAAVRAAQMGRSVMLVDDRSAIGGLTVSGLQFTDAHSATKLRATIPASSVANQLFSRLATRYGLNFNRYFFDKSFASESKGSLAEINTLLAANGIVPVINQELLSVVKSGTDIATVTFSGIGAVTAKQYIDTSYTGDLLAMSGADYYLGGEAASTYSETAQQAGAVYAGTQPTSNIDPYNTPATPASGLIKYVQPGGVVAAGSAVPGKVQFPSFRLNLTATPGKKIAVPAPSNYVASDYELHRRDALLNKQGATTAAAFFNMQTTFGPIPTTTAGINKYDGNNVGAISHDFPDVVLITEYFTPGTTRARRLQIEDIVWQYFLGYYYFLTTDTSIPVAARTDVASYGFPNDDYLATNGRPPRMYPREAIRAVGDVVTAAPSITALNAVTNPCCIAYYAFDKHSRQLVVSSTGGDHVTQEGATPAAVAQAAVGAKFPATILNPKKAQVTNLQVVTCPSMTQMTFNSFRLEPLMSVASEYAAYRAALAISTNTGVQDVPHASVAVLHNLYGLDTPNAPTITSDGTTRTNGTMSFGGTWSVAATTLLGTVSIQSCTATSGTNTVTVTPTITAPGNYRVEMKYSDVNTTTRGSITMVVTASGVAQTPQVVNQSSADAGVTNNGDWQSLGTFAFTAADGANNKVVGTTDNTGNPVNIAAMRFVPVP